MSKKKDVPLLMSAAGVIGGLADKLVAKFKALGALNELHELMVGERSEEFVSQVVDLATKMVGAVRDGFHIVVDYSKSLADMILAGAYDWVNSDITSEHFPVKGKGKVELNPELVHYGQGMSSDEIVQDMDKRGLRPGTLAELLAFGAKYPDKQREFPIVALGSVWQVRDGNRFVAFLHSNDSKRKLFLNVWDGDWCGGYRFLAFRK